MAERRAELSGGALITGGTGRPFGLHSLVNEQLVLGMVSICISVYVCVCVAPEQFIISYYSPPGQG